MRYSIGRNGKGGGLKMRVCDVVMNSIWYDPRVRRQLIEYRNQGIDVIGIGLKCPRYDKNKISDIPAPVRIVSIPEHCLGKQGLFGKLLRRYRQFTVVRDAIIEMEPDVIHANDLDALIPSYFAKKKLKCRLVYDAHEIFAENFANRKGIKVYLTRLLTTVEKKLVRKVDHMICVSHAAAEYFEKAYGIRRPTVVTNCALKSDCISGGIFEKRDVFEVLNHGQFYEGRGYDIMVKACDYLADYPGIRLAIRGYGKMESKLREMVEESNCSQQFVFYPGVLVEELIPMAAKSHVGVAITEPTCLNFKLSVSNKLFEYAAAGLPVIMSDVPEHRYLNEKYNFGLILRDNSPEAFAETVKKLYTDQMLYRQLAENAKKMSAEMTWENEFAKLLTEERKMIADR